MRRYIEIYWMIVRNSLIRDMSFKANFMLWMVVEVLWFSGQIVFVELLFGYVDRIGDWSKWEVVLLIGTHQLVARFSRRSFSLTSQISPSSCGWENSIPFWCCQIDSQFAVSTKQFGLDSIVNALLGALVVVVSLCRAQRRAEPTFRFALCGGASFRNRRALLHHARPGRGELLDHSCAGTGVWLFQFSQYRALPGCHFPWFFRLIFGWVIPVVIIANIPAPAH